MASWQKAGDAVVKSNKVASKFANMTLPKDKCIRCNKVVYANERERYICIYYYNISGCCILYYF